MKRYFFFIILFLISSTSAITLSNHTLNNSIFINESINLQRLNITEKVNLYGINTTGIFTNLRNRTQNLSFYDLTEPNNDIVFWNNTPIKLDVINTEIEIKNYEIIKLGDYTGPVIYIINPKVGEDENFPPVSFLINTSEKSTCKINIDSNSNQTMITSNNEFFSYEQNLENGLHNANFYCEDLLGNLNNKSIDFYFYKKSGYADIIPEEQIKLENISIRYDNWYKNELNSIYIYSLDKEGNFVDLTDLEIYSNLGEIDLIRLGEGVYRAILQSKNWDKIEISIKAIDNEKIIIKEFIIELKEKTNLEKIKESILQKTSRLIRDNLFIKIICWFIILAFIYLLCKTIFKKQCNTLLYWLGFKRKENI